jgi:elongation factor Ts
MQITAAMVKELRERTGAGMMECKKALSEVGGDMDAAIDLMRKSGQAKAVKKAGRVAAEGTIMIEAEGSAAAIVEVNCETDFVAKDENFVGFAAAVAKQILGAKPADVAALAEVQLGGQSVEEARQALVTKVG